MRVTIAYDGGETLGQPARHRAVHVSVVDYRREVAREHPRRGKGRDEGRETQQRPHEALFVAEEHRRRDDHNDDDVENQAHGYLRAAPKARQV